MYSYSLQNLFAKTKLGFNIFKMNENQESFETYLRFLEEQQKRIKEHKTAYGLKR